MGNVDCQYRKKFFFVSPSLGIDWRDLNGREMLDRRAIGVNLKEFYGKKDAKWRFVIDGITYEISRLKAEVLGRKYVLPGNWPMPNLLPLAEFRLVKMEKPKIDSMQLSLI